MTLQKNKPNRRPILVQSACLAALLAFGLPAMADQVQVPVGQQAGGQGGQETPRKGIAKAKVQEQFGEPRQKRSAVGDPPISSWEYSDYVVYFEGDKVLHSVRKHRPRQEAGNGNATDSNGG